MTAFVTVSVTGSQATPAEQPMERDRGRDGTRLMKMHRSSREGPTSQVPGAAKEE
jgi:hypothetical protein